MDLQNLKQIFGDKSLHGFPTSSSSKFSQKRYYGMLK
jgi:hypothetical protein